MAKLGADVPNKYKGKEVAAKARATHVEKKNMSINEYSLKIKGIVESLASINVFVDDDDLVSVCLNGLGKGIQAFQDIHNCQGECSQLLGSCVNANCRR
jgi:hypothetical protein